MSTFKPFNTLVKNPPWYFGGELFEIIIKIDPKIHLQLLPPHLMQINQKPLVSITFTDMVSASTISELQKKPQSTQYKECLIKVLCQYDLQKFWYVPYCWVTSDFSLLRGYLLGFDKKIGNIFTTKQNPINYLNSKRTIDRNLTTICIANDGTYINLNFTNCKKKNFAEYNNIGICTSRYIPNFANNDIIINDLCTLKVSKYLRNEEFSAKGELVISTQDNLLSNLNSHEVIMARFYKEKFCLEGIKIIQNLLL